MNEARDFKARKKTKKTQKEVNQTFRNKHQLIQVPFKKVPAIGNEHGPSEYEILLKNASRYSISLARFIRDCALEPKIRVIEKRPLVNDKLLIEIHKIGVNINQMAYKINAKVDEKEFPEFDKKLEELDHKLNELMDLIRAK